MLGIREATPLALYRGHGHRAFDDREVRLLQILLPHSQRGLELEQRLGVARMSLATLDALPTAVAIVDTDLQLHFLNAAGRALVRTPQAPITAVRSGGGNSNLRLAVRSRRETADVLRLVASAASGGAGGSIRVLGEAGSFALLVSPAPAGLIADDRASRLLQGFALILLQPLRRLTPPPLSVLCDVLGLSVAEAEVAAALFGGRSAEEVARRRGVSLPTIRNQIRAILLKAETDNLRDLERLLADLAAVTHPQAR
jgi:DNA-binding CsgD family transcriptional regulator